MFVRGWAEGLKRKKGKKGEKNLLRSYLYI